MRTCLGDVDGIAIRAGAAAVDESANANLTGLPEQAVPFLELDDAATAALEDQDVAVWLLRHLEGARSHGPILLIKLDHRAAREARQVGGKIIGPR